MDFITKLLNTIGFKSSDNKISDAVNTRSENENRKIDYSSDVVFAQLEQDAKRITLEIINQDIALLYNMYVAFTGQDESGQFEDKGWSAKVDDYIRNIIFGNQTIFRFNWSKYSTNKERCDSPQDVFTKKVQNGKNVWSAFDYERLILGSITEYIKKHEDAGEFFILGEISIEDRSLIDFKLNLTISTHEDAVEALSKKSELREKLEIADEISAVQIKQAIENISQAIRKYERLANSYFEANRDFVEFDASFHPGIQNEYDTDAGSLTCSCKDWTETRSIYQKDDPRRLCKHIINKLNIKNLPHRLDRFRESIRFYKQNERGFKSFKELIEIPNSNIVVCYCEPSDWSDVFENGKCYGFMLHDYNGKIRWAKDIRPRNYHLVEKYFSKTIMPPSPTGNERTIIIEYLKSNFPQYDFSNLHFSAEHSIGTNTNNEIVKIFEAVGIPDIIYDAKGNVFDILEVTVSNTKLEFHSYSKTILVLDRDINDIKH